MKIEQTPRNINKLAWNVVINEMDLRVFIQWAYEHYQTYYESMTPEEFDEAWHQQFD